MRKTRKLRLALMLAAALMMGIPTVGAVTVKAEVTEGTAAAAENAELPAEETTETPSEETPSEEETGTPAVTLQVKSGTDITSELQAALDLARYGVEDTLEITVPAGSYTVSDCMKLYSNTTLILTGATIRKSSDFTKGMSMFRLGRYKEIQEKGGLNGYSGFSHITIVGGVLSGAGKEGAILRVAHAKYITLTDCTFTNVKKSHLVEMGGVANVTITGCTFSEFKGSKTDWASSTNYEGLQFDILQEDHFGSYENYDYTPCKSVKVDHCTFQGLQRGMGTHSAMSGSYFTKFTITNNTFKDIYGYAIIATNYKKTVIKGNKISDCGSGIMFRTMNAGYKNFYGLKAPVVDTDSVISGNKISVTDKGFKNVNYGIQLYGETLSKKQGTIPAGDYTVQGVTVSDNKITLASKGYAIWLNGASKNTISGNTIKCAVKTGSTSGNGDGIRVQSSSKSNTIKKNTITNSVKTGKGADMCGISIISGSTKNKLTDNTVKGASKDGISVQDSGSVTLSGNVVTESGRDGIAVKRSTKVTMTSNTANSNTGYGIYITDKATVTKCSGNKASGNKGIRDGKKSGRKDNNKVVTNGAKVTGKL